MEPAASQDRAAAHDAPQPQEDESTESSPGASGANRPRIVGGSHPRPAGGEAEIVLEEPANPGWQAYNTGPGTLELVEDKIVKGLGLRRSWGSTTKGFLAGGYKPRKRRNGNAFGLSLRHIADE